MSDTQREQKRKYYMREYSKNREKLHPEIYRESSKKYYYSHIDQEHKRLSYYQKTHRKQHREYMHKWREKKKEVNHKI